MEAVGETKVRLWPLMEVKPVMVPPPCAEKYAGPSGSSIAVLLPVMFLAVTEIPRPLPLSELNTLPSHATSAHGE